MIIVLYVLLAIAWLALLAWLVEEYSKDGTDS